jgi:hypothetical protein
MKHPTLLFTAALLLLLPGCTTAPPALPPDLEMQAKSFAPVPGMCIVYIFRPYNFIGSGAISSVLINGIHIANLSVRNCIRVELPEGQYTIRVGTKYVYLDRSILADPGQVYFFKDATVSSNSFVNVAPSEAMTTIRTFKFVYSNPYPY